MLTADITRSARLKMLNRLRLIRNAGFNDPVERRFTATQIRRGEAADEIGPWLAESLGENLTSPVLYTFSVEHAEIAQVIQNAFGGLPAKQDRGYCLPRRNGEGAGQTTLYVGGSER